MYKDRESERERFFFSSEWNVPAKDERKEDEIVSSSVFFFLSAF